jgi:hypothetical protein
MKTRRMCKHNQDINKCKKCKTLTFLQSSIDYKKNKDGKKGGLK